MLQALTSQKIAKRVNSRRSEILLAVLVLLSLLAVALEGGLWQRTRTFSGPFQTEADRPGVLSLWLGGSSRIERLLLDISGDTRSRPMASTLTLRIGELEVDAPHTLHDEIGKRRPSFSHWDNGLFFSLPPGTPNDATAQITVRYPVRLKGWLFALVLFSTGLLAYRLHGDQLTPDRVSMLLRLPAAGLLGIGYAGFAVTAIFLLSIIVGLFIGAALPTTVLIKWSAVAAALARLEPELPYVILVLCLAGAAASWHKASSTDGEQRLARFYGRWGFFLVLALYVFSASAQWAGVLRPGDLSWASIAGLLPFSDAGDYFADASDSARFGVWSDVSARRPMAAATRTSLAFLSGYSYSVMVLLQAMLLAGVTFLASVAVSRWRGVWAGLVFAAISIMIVEAYVPTSLTEPLGLFWGFLAVPPLLHALRTKSLVSALFGLAVTTVALLTRMGAMFIVPALGLWIAWCFGANLVQKTKATVLVVIVLLAVAGANWLLVRIYADPQDQYQTGSNFAYTLCGISIGEDWSGCPKRYRSEFAAQPDDRARVRYLYAKALDNLRNDPRTFAARLWTGVSGFVSDAPNILLQGYMLVVPPKWFPQGLCVSLCFLAASFMLVARSSPQERLFWLLLVLGTVTSAAFVYVDDGRRVLVASYPLLAVGFTMGLVGPRRCRAVAGERYTRFHAMPTENAWSLATAAVVLTCSIVLPALAIHLAHSIPTVSIVERQGEHVVFGGRRLSGFIVTADDVPTSFSVPTITLSDFRAIVKHSNIEAYQGLLTPEAPPVPFGLVAGESIERGVRSGFLYIVPEDVVRRCDVALWRFSVSDWQLKPGNPTYWYFVTHAEPARIQ